MAELLTLTPSPVRVTSAVTWEPIYSSLDVARFDQIDLMIQILSIENDAGADATLDFMTGMQTDTDDGWVIAFSIVGIPAIGTYFSTTTSFLQSMRWRISAFSGMDAMTFWIGGVGRTYCCDR